MGCGSKMLVGVGKKRAKFRLRHVAESLLSHSWAGQVYAYATVSWNYLHVIYILDCIYSSCAVFLLNGWIVFVDMALYGSAFGQIVGFEPFECVARVIVIEHSADVWRIIPKVAKAARVIIGFFVLFMHFVAKPSGQQGEKFADVTRVGMHKCVRSKHSELSIDRHTANPAAGNATKLREDCSRVIE